MREHGLVDIHCHVLPGMDDGPAHLDDSLRMLDSAQSDGIELVVATPHSDRAPAETVLAAVDGLNAAARERGMHVVVVPGQEIAIEADIVPRLKAGELLPLNGTPYVLIELPLTTGWPSFLGTALYDLQMGGYSPLLAHAERYPAVQRDPTILLGPIAAGLIIQVNADAVLGLAGQRAQRTSHRLLQARMAHVIASDAHSLRSRPLRIRAALEQAGRLNGAWPSDRYARLTNDIVCGSAITLPDPDLTPEVSWFRRITTIMRR